MSEHSATGDWTGRASTAAEWPAIPGYEILEELGRGGMGVVYKAQELRGGRLVALKMIRDSALAGRDQQVRFRIEAEAAARMRHPHIVEIFEIGQHSGRPYFAMELVEGRRLDERLASGPLPARQAAELVYTLALAVEHAHQRQIIHRDLKPANILLARDAASQDAREIAVHIGVPKITDFGLAKRLDADSTAWTPEGAVVGTPSYMAPEQAAGRVSSLGPGVDIYALGVILYETLTGRPPFQGDSWTHTIQQVLNEEAPPPSLLQPDVPPALEAVCLKCLEKEKDQRYASAGELSEDLRRFLDNQPTLAMPFSPLQRLARYAWRDGYRIMAEIGRGPRSTVYHAQNERLNQPVALKVFERGICTLDEWDSRFRRGADSWAGIAHPQVVGVHQAGWWDGAPFVALEYAAQGNLASTLRGRPQPVAQALALIEQLTGVVIYLHRQGVVHGNLKPSNILLGANGIPRIGDFRLTGGLFHAALPAEDQPPAGLEYVAPEFLPGSKAEARPYTDIYGLGLILYELLTGRPPFGGSCAREVVDRVRSEEPAPPSRFNSQVSGSLDRVCLRCLRKNPWQRYYRAYDLARRLRSLMDDPGGANPPGNWR